MSFVLHDAKKGGRRLAATLIAAALAFGAVSPAMAGSFEVNPVNVELAPGRSSTSITIRNNDVDPVSVRVVTMKWTQENGKDIYTPTKDVIVSPPIFTVDGKNAQTIRLGLRSRTPGAAYRVILEEIPSEKADSTAIQIALRLNLPLYVLEDNGEAKVSWTVSSNPLGGLVIEGRNDGTRHLQILELSTRDEKDRRVTLSNEMGVVLPGSSRQWNVSGEDVRLSTVLPISVRSQGSETAANAVVVAN